MNIKRKLKTLAAAFLVVAGMLAPFGALAVDGEWSPEDSNGTKYKITGFTSLSDRSLSRPDKQPGILLTWSFSFMTTFRLPDGRATGSRYGNTWDQFTVWRDGKEIGKVNDTRWPFYYRDIDAVPGESYTYFVSSSLGPAYSPPITQLCYMNYDAWAEKEMFHLGKKGGGDSVKVCLQKKEVTSISEQGVGISASLAEWTATSNSDWLKLSGANNRGTVSYLNPGTNSILFTVNPNETGEARTAIISIGVPVEDGMVVKKITVVQDATPTCFTINFDACGGTGNTSELMREEDEKLGELPEVKLDGGIFLGWFTEAEGGEAVAADTVVTGDATYYAHWIRLGEPRAFTDANGILWKYLILDRGTAEHTDLYVKIVGDGNYPVSGGSIVETGAIDKSTAGELEIPPSLEGYPVRVIGQWAFAYCRNLMKVTIPDSVDTIEDCAFASCSGMESVHFGANVAMIGSGAFLYCTALKTLTLPERADALGASAFGGCESLRYLRAEGNFSSGCHIAMGYWIGGMMFNLVDNGVDMDPFWDCTGLSCIELGTNVTEVCLDGFGKGPNLRSVICRGMLPTFLGGNTSYGRTTCYVLRENYPNGLPAETWAGMELRYLDGDGPSENAEVDFYVAGAFLASSASDVEGTTAFKVGEPVLLSYTMSERWSVFGMETQVVNRITVRRGSDDSVVGYEDDLVVEIGGRTSVERKGMELDCLKGLPEGDYVLEIDLNTAEAAAETDYANNSVSIAFTVVGEPRYTVTFNANGGTVSPATRQVESGSAIGTLPTPTWSDHAFVGWFTSANGGTQISASTRVTANVTYYAHWTTTQGPTPSEPTPIQEDPVGVSYGFYDSVAGAVPGTAATTYDGYLCDANGDVKGTIQVKVGKANAKTGLAAVRATVIGLDGKKKSLKAVEKGKVKIDGDGPTTVSLAGGDACEVKLGSDGMSGTYGNYAIDGALNVFTSKDAADKDVATAALGKWQGAVNVAWEGAQGWNGLSVTIAAKGKAKVAGTLANGTKVSAKGQLIVGEEWCCIPVLETKKAHLAFIVWLPLAATSAAAPVVVGLGADVKVGKPGTLKGGAAFRLDTAMGDAKYETYLPDGLAVAGGAKWTLPKAGKVQLAKNGAVDASKLGENPSALRLTYKAKDGSFKGSFKAYSDVGGKPKGTTVKVTGVLVNGVGYGTASVKDGNVPVKVE